MAESLILDTSAIIAFIEDEPGADTVSNALIDATLAFFVSIAVS